MLLIIGAIVLLGMLYLGGRSGQKMAYFVVNVFYILAASVMYILAAPFYGQSYWFPVIYWFIILAGFIWIARDQVYRLDGDAGPWEDWLPFLNPNRGQRQCFLFLSGIPMGLVIWIGGLLLLEKLQIVSFAVAVKITTTAGYVGAPLFGTLFLIMGKRWIDAGRR